MTEEQNQTGDLLTSKQVFSLLEELARRVSGINNNASYLNDRITSLELNLKYFARVIYTMIDLAEEEGRKCPYCGADPGEHRLDCDAFAISERR